MKNKLLVGIGIVAVLVIMGFMVFDKPTPPPETPSADFNFVFRYGVGAKNELNTFSGTYTKDMVMDPSITTSLVLSESERATIYQKINEIGLLKNDIVPNKGNIYVTPCSNYSLKVRADNVEKEISWDDCRGEINEKLQELTDHIISVIQSNEAYKNLPAAKGGYM
jgi:hypothetical protein